MAKPRKTSIGYYRATDDTYARLKVLAATRGIPVGTFVSILVEKYVNSPQAQEHLAKWAQKVSIQPPQESTDAERETHNYCTP